MEKFVEVDGQKFVDDGTGSPKLDEDGNQVPFVEQKENMIPESRFNEVYKNFKDLEREIATLKEGKKEGTLTEEQQKELQAKQYLKGLLTETLKEQEQTRQQQEEQEMATFKEQVNEALSINTDVKRDEFLKFLETDGDDFSSVTSAMKGFRKINELSAEAEKAKNKGIKPKLPVHEGGGSPAKPDDKGKSLWQIAEEAQQELAKR